MKTGFIRHFENCNSWDKNNFTPLLIADKELGFIKHDIANHLRAQTSYFTSHNHDLQLNPQFDNFDKRSQALADVTKILNDFTGTRLRHEMWPVIEKWDDAPLAQIDRSAFIALGIPGFGVYLNGFVRKPSGLFMWIGERAKNKDIDPGKLDMMVAGGQPIDISLEDNLCKEAYEEAGMEEAMTRKAKLSSILSYKMDFQRGTNNHVMYIYDLELPADFTPNNTDGETAGFHLLPIAEVAQIIHDTDNMKYNCNLVAIDFLMRHGAISETHPEYDALLRYVRA